MTMHKAPDYGEPEPDCFYSELQRARLDYVCPKPIVLQGRFHLVKEDAQKAGIFGSAKSKTESQVVSHHFPNLKGLPVARLERAPAPSSVANGSLANGHSDVQPRQLRVGVVLSGGQAPGGHNVIAGLLDCLQQRFPGSRLFGFLNGPKGIVTRTYKEIIVDMMLAFRNQGGFHMIGSGRDKIEKAEDLEAAAATARELRLDGLVVCGGDDSNTNAAVLAEYFLANGIETGVIGVPKTIDGDLKNANIPTSFGFDTACKVFSELVGNIMVDAVSAKKYYHFVRLMGRAASHITLETALQTHPQAAIICEEVDAQGLGLADITRQLADMVAARERAGKRYGVVLIPEGLIEHVPEVRALISELNELMADAKESAPDAAAIAAQLTPANRTVFELLPAAIQLTLLLERDPHGNVQVSRIDTEKLLLALVEKEVDERVAAGAMKSRFTGLPHFFGYEGRCSLPTNFDATYTYTLGYVAAALIAEGQTGLMACAGNLQRPTAEWSVGGHPLINMMCIERRRGKDKPVIRKAMVDLTGPAFKAFAAQREHWALHDCFRSPGPIQFHGSGANSANFTLSLEINGGQPIYTR